MPTVKEIIARELRKACTAATEKHRAKQEKKEKKEKYSEGKIGRVKEIYAKLGYNSGQTDMMMEALSILLEAPELKARALLPTDTLTVIVVDDNKGVHNYNKGVPYIVVNRDGNNGVSLLHHDGRVGPSWVGVADLPRYATNEEIAQCIANLNQPQWKAIQSGPVFASVMDAAMSKQVESEDEESKETEADSEGVIEFPDGRTVAV